MDFNKAKVEKAAKHLEQNGLADELKTDNRSVTRAVARYLAAQTLYPELSPQELVEAIYTAFYLDAKWQIAWEVPFKNSTAALLGDYLQGKLVSPAVRGRRKEVPIPEPLPEVVDLAAVLTPEVTAV